MPRTVTLYVEAPGESGGQVAPVGRALTARVISGPVRSAPPERRQQALGVTMAPLTVTLCRPPSAVIAVARSAGVTSVWSYTPLMERRRGGVVATTGSSRRGAGT